MDLAVLNDAASMGGYTRYGTAKLASMAFSSEMARRLPDIRSNSVHPGVVASNMLRLENFQSMLGPLLGPVAFRVAKLRNLFFAYSTKVAAVNLLYCAVLPEENETGNFYVPLATKWLPRHGMAHDVGFGSQFWDFSKSLVDDALNRRKHKLLTP